MQTGNSLDFAQNLTGYTFSKLPYSTTAGELPLTRLLDLTILTIIPKHISLVACS